ncbi:MAG: uroporphyrinogen-III synthase [Bacteroidales bacterium]|nr:uroporphyrinogen-III synthase [Bacteroidales bacterium]
MKVKRVLISQPAPENGKSPYGSLTEKYGVRFNFRPFIKVEHIGASEFRKQHVEFDNITSIVFSSKVGVDHFFKLAEEIRFKVSEQMRYVCKSEAVGNYLQTYIQLRKRKVFCGNGTTKDMVAVMEKHASENFLVALPDGNNEELLSLLEATKLNYQVGLMYRTVSNDFGPDESLENYDAFVFYSPEGINALKKNFPNFEQGERYIGCLGENTAQAIENAGLRLDIPVNCRGSKYRSLVEALTDFLKENHKGSHK